MRRGFSSLQTGRVANIIEFCRVLNALWNAQIEVYRELGFWMLLEDSWELELFCSVLCLLG